MTVQVGFHYLHAYAPLLVPSGPRFCALNINNHGAVGDSAVRVLLLLCDGCELRHFSYTAQHTERFAASGLFCMIAVSAPALKSD